MICCTQQNLQKSLSGHLQNEANLATSAFNEKRHWFDENRNALCQDLAQWSTRAFWTHWTPVRASGSTHCFIRSMQKEHFTLRRVAQWSKQAFPTLQIPVHVRVSVDMTMNIIIQLSRIFIHRLKLWYAYLGPSTARCSQRIFTHLICQGKYHSVGDLVFNSFGISQKSKYVVNST